MRGGGAVEWCKDFFVLYECGDEWRRRFRGWARERGRGLFEYRLWRLRGDQRRSLGRRALRSRRRIVREKGRFV